MANSGIYTTALMDHNAHPDYKYEMDGATHTHEGINPSCGDELTLSLRVKDGVIEEAAFTGHGCAVSQASADMMEHIGEDALAERCRDRVIKGKELTEQDKIDLDEAAQLQDISHMPARVKCAELAWRTLDGMLRENADAAPATTE